MQVGKIGLEADHRDVRHEGDMSEESRRNYDVFISYSSKDKKWADATCAILERHRIRCWVAPRGITPETSGCGDHEWYGCEQDHGSGVLVSCGTESRAGFVARSSGQ